MVNWTKLIEALEQRGDTVRRFATKEEAAGYLDSQIDGDPSGRRGAGLLT